MCSPSAPSNRDLASACSPTPNPGSGCARPDGMTSRQRAPCSGQDVLVHRNNGDLRRAMRDHASCQREDRNARAALRAVLIAKRQLAARLWHCIMSTGIDPLPDIDSAAKACRRLPVRRPTGLSTRNLVDNPVLFVRISGWLFADNIFLLHTNRRQAVTREILGVCLTRATERSDPHVARTRENHSGGDP